MSIIKNKYLVRIKSWEELLEIGNIDENGDILLSDGYFTKRMKELCEKEVLLVKKKRSLGKLVKPSYFYMRSDDDTWLVTPSMYDILDTSNIAKTNISVGSNMVSINKGIANGLPCLKDTRITLSQLIDALGDGMTTTEFAEVLEVDIDKVDDALRWLSLLVSDSDFMKKIRD